MTVQLRAKLLDDGNGLGEVSNDLAEDLAGIGASDIRQHARVHAPLVEQLDPLRRQITRGRASVEITQLARNEELLTRLERLFGDRVATLA